MWKGSRTGCLQLVDKRIVKRFFVFIWDPPHQADAFRGRSAEPPRRKLLRGLITPFFRRSRHLVFRILKWWNNKHRRIISSRKWTQIAHFDKSLEVILIFILIRLCLQSKTALFKRAVFSVMLSFRVLCISRTNRRSCHSR